MIDANIYTKIERCKMSKISIIIPCYNVESKILRCLNSILSQTFNDFTCYLIDDGSTDSTESIIKETIYEDYRFKYIYKENGGQASARNLGLKLCDTELVTFIDSDDYIEPFYLEKLIQPFSDSNLEMTACYFNRVYEDKTNINTFNKKDLVLSKYPSVWGKVFKKSIIINNSIKFPEGLWYEDLSFYSKYISCCKNFEVINQCLYEYIQNPNSTMYTFSNKIYDIYTVIDDLIDFNVEREVIEYLTVYHVLVGTVFRASFKKDFSLNELKSINIWVEERFSKWYKNKYIKQQLSLFYRIYLSCLKLHLYKIIYLMLKTFNRLLRL